MGSEVSPSNPATAAPASNTSDKQTQDSARIHHTLTACVRCRSRKTRCDAGLPRCDGCERSNSQCEYYDASKNRVISRSYITNLQETVRRLQAELKSIEAIEDEEEPDHESMARAPGLVRFRESDDSRFLGPSSGIATARFVMDFARQNANRKTIRDVVPDSAAQEIKNVNDQESKKPTSKVYPLTSSVPATSLPNRGLMDQLLAIFEVKAQYMLPVLHEPSFRRSVDLVYNGSTDAVLNFQVRMVIAISMQKLDTQYAGLADSYYVAALPYLAEAVKRKSVETLQCFALMGSYSLLTPTRTAAYWVIGLAAKLCQELGLCDESTIDKPPSGTRPNFLEIDMRRRLFWIITSMEYGLAHSLGRPSAFGVSVENINVGFFQLCDDSFISPEGLLPGSYPIMKKCISIHFLKMRLLQAEIRRMLYLRKRERPTSDQDPWFQHMLASIDEWVQNTPRNDEGSGLSPAWFEGRKNTMIVMMYRPCPQIPEPTPAAAERCYRASIFNIGLQKRQVENKLIDITWIFTQAIHMAINTVLWSISYPQVRAEHPRDEVEQHLSDALDAIILCADRWPGVTSAHQLYRNLIIACLKAYDPVKAATPSVSGTSESARSMDGGQSSNTTYTSPRSPASTSGYSIPNPQSPQSYTTQPSMLSSDAGYGRLPLSCDARPTSNQYPGVHNDTALSSPHSSRYATTSPSELAQSMHHSTDYGSGGVIQYPNGSQPLPSWETITTTAYDMNAHYTGTALDQAPWFASFGDFQQAPDSDTIMAYQAQSLTAQEQMDLMAALEQSQIPDVSGMISDATTFYTAGLP